MQWLRGVFWGVVTGVDFLALLLFIDLWLGGTSVMYWLMDATYGVWYFALGGAMLGLSFGISKSRNKGIKIPRLVRTGAVSHLQITSLPSNCQQIKVRRG